DDAPPRQRQAQDCDRPRVSAERRRRGASLPRIGQTVRQGHLAGGALTTAAAAMSPTPTGLDTAAMIAAARRRGDTALSEVESKALLREIGIPTPAGRSVA